MAPTCNDCAAILAESNGIPAVYATTSRVARLPLGDPMTRARRVWLLAAIVVSVAVAVAIAARFPSGSRAAAPKGPSAVAVTSAPIVVKSMPVKLSAIGNVEPSTSVAIRARVDGEIVAVHFKEGDAVRKGAVLFELDSRPFKAVLDQANANLAKDRAQLERANAQDTRYHD